MDEFDFFDPFDLSDKSCTATLSITVKRASLVDLSYEDWQVVHMSEANWSYNRLVKSCVALLKSDNLVIDADVDAVHQAYIEGGLKLDEHTIKWALTEPIADFITTCVLFGWGEKRRIEVIGDHIRFNVSGGQRLVGELLGRADVNATAMPFAILSKLVDQLDNDGLTRLIANSTVDLTIRDNKGDNFYKKLLRTVTQSEAHRYDNSAQSKIGALAALLQLPTVDPNETIMYKTHHGHHVVNRPVHPILFVALHGRRRDNLPNFVKIMLQCPRIDLSTVKLPPSLVSEISEESMRLILRHESFDIHNLLHHDDFNPVHGGALNIAQWIADFHAAEDNQEMNLPLMQL